MHLFKTSFNYDHPWSHVQLGLWRKYPNPHCSHVTTVDVLDRSIDPQTGVIRTERVLGCKQKAPAWILKFLGGSENAFVREVIFVDPVNQRTSIVSTNMSMSQYMTCLERIHYIPAPSRQLEQTLFSQTAEIQTRVPVLRSLANRLEKWSCERFGDNARLGRMGFEFVLRNLWTDKTMRRVEHQ